MANVRYIIKKIFSLFLLDSEVFREKLQIREDLIDYVVCRTLLNTKK